MNRTSSSSSDQTETMTPYGARDDAGAGTAVDNELLAVVAQLEGREQMTTGSAAGATAASAYGVAAAAPALSLYEELLRYQEEHPDEGSQLLQNGDSTQPPGQQRETSRGSQQSGGSDCDRKPAAIPNGVYRQPISRTYFARKSTSLSPRTSQGEDIVSSDEVGTGSLSGADEAIQRTQDTTRRDSGPERNTEQNESNNMSLYEELKQQCLEESRASRAQQAESDEALARRIQSEFNRSWPGSPGTTPLDHKTSEESDTSNLLLETKRLVKSLSVEAPLALGDSHGQTQSSNDRVPDDIEQQRRLLESFQKQKEQRQVREATRLSQAENHENSNKDKVLQDWSSLRRSQRRQPDSHDEISLQSHRSVSTTLTWDDRQRGRSLYREGHRNSVPRDIYSGIPLESLESRSVSSADPHRFRRPLNAPAPHHGADDESSRLRSRPVRGTDSAHPWPIPPGRRSLPPRAHHPRMSSGRYSHADEVDPQLIPRQIETYPADNSLRLPDEGHDLQSLPDHYRYRAQHRNISPPPGSGESHYSEPTRTHARRVPPSSGSSLYSTSSHPRSGSSAHSIAGRHAETELSHSHSNAMSTYDGEIADEESLIVECLGCHQYLQAPPGSENVLCPSCGQVSPCDPRRVEL